MLSIKASNSLNCVGFESLLQNPHILVTSHNPCSETPLISPMSRSYHPFPFHVQHAQILKLNFWFQLIELSIGTIREKRLKNSTRTWCPWSVPMWNHTREHTVRYNTAWVIWVSQPNDRNRLSFIGWAYAFYMLHVQRTRVTECVRGVI